MASPVPPKFTLRFRNRRNHELLGLLAQHFGVTKNQLAEQMLERELQAAALLMENDLTRTLALLRQYRRDEHLPAAIDAFAQAEAAEEDPIKTRVVDPASTQDSFGVADAFG